jgi:hypothetical protein
VGKTFKSMKAVDFKAQQFASQVTLHRQTPRIEESASRIIVGTLRLAMQLLLTISTANRIHVQN